MQKWEYIHFTQIVTFDRSGKIIRAEAMENSKPIPNQTVSGYLQQRGEEGWEVIGWSESRAIDPTANHAGWEYTMLDRSAILKRPKP